MLDDQSLRPYALSPESSSFDADQLAHMTKLTLAFNEIIREKADEYDATLVDFYNTTILTDAETLDEDGIHPNSAGYDIIAQMWIDAIHAFL